jgi:hypothetical protein
MSSDSLLRSRHAGKSNTRAVFLPPNLRSLCAEASRRATGGNVKGIAAFCKLPAKRFYTVNEEEGPGAAEMLARKMAGALLHGASRADALAELHLLVSLFDPQRQEAEANLEDATATLSRECGECVAAVVEAMRGGVKPQEFPAIERAGRELIEAIERMLIEAKAASGLRRMEIAK